MRVFKLLLLPPHPTNPHGDDFCCSGGCNSWEHRGKYPLRQESICSRITPKDCDCSWPPLGWAATPQGGNSYHELCKLSSSPNPTYSYSVRDQFMLRPSLPNNPANLHCCSAPGTDSTLWTDPSDASGPSFSLLPAASLQFNPSSEALVRQQQCQPQDILQN